MIRYLLPILLISGAAMAHPGGLDAHGCHTDRSTGEYHCHRDGSAPRAEPKPAPIIAGQASVIDGDTLEIHGRRIRMHGIDAPESRQQCHIDGRAYLCGQQAANALDAKIARRPVECEQRDIDRYKRVVAVCRVAGEDLNGWMVAQGHALAYRQYGRDYVAAEEEAKAAKRGIWAGEFVAPWDWRRGKR